MKLKYKFLIIIICILSATLWIFFKKTEQKTTHFPISHVIFEGEYWQVPQSSLETIVAPYIAQGYFSVNLPALQHELLDKEPWLQSAAVSRQWPSSIVLVLQQKTAVALLNNNALITESGEVFSPSTDSFPPDLPVLTGPKERAGEMLSQYKVFTSIATSVNLVITKLQLSSEGNWSVEINNKIVVMLGENDILARFNRFIKVYQQVFVPEHREPGSVDMRYNHGMAVNWAQASAK